MPRKITNPLREGLPAKIYLIAYEKAISGYKIAEEVYGRKYAPTSKIYPWTKELENGGFISKTPEGFLSRAEPLISEIEMLLKNDQKKGLTDFEKHILLIILDSKEFRSFLHEKLIKKFREGKIGDVDSARIILEALGIITSQTLLAMKLTKYDEPEPKTKQEFDRLWKKLSSQKKEEIKINEYLQERNQAFKKFGFKELDKYDKEIMEQNIGLSIKLEPFLAVPKKTLQKISSLFPLSNYFQTFVYNLFSEMSVFLEKYAQNREEEGG